MSITDLAKQYEEATSLAELALLVSGDSAKDPASRDSKDVKHIAKLLREIAKTPPVTKPEALKRLEFLRSDYALQLLDEAELQRAQEVSTAIK